MRQGMECHPSFQARRIVSELGGNPGMSEFVRGCEDPKQEYVEQRGRDIELHVYSRRTMAAHRPRSASTATTLMIPIQPIGPLHVLQWVLHHHFFPEVQSTWL